MLFSEAAFSQLHFNAEVLPQEHLAWVAQTQPDPDLRQQVVGTAIFFKVDDTGFKGQRHKLIWRFCNSGRRESLRVSYASCSYGNGSGCVKNKWKLKFGKRT